MNVPGVNSVLSMMMRQSIPDRGKVVKTLVKRLRDAGYNARFVNDRAVPEWWSKDAEAEPGATSHLKIAVARRLGLDVEAILERDEILPVVPAGAKFKRSTDLEQIAPPDGAVAFCAALARNIAAAMKPSAELPSSGDALRKEILDEQGDAYVSLDALLRYCWKRNIAVISVSEMPTSKKGMDALVYRSAGRDVIVLTKKIANMCPAWASFLVAHELGHIALGHVVEGELLEDEFHAEDGGVDIEQAANDFAQTVLAGAHPPYICAELSTPQILAATAYREGMRYRVDPDHLILRYGIEHKDYFPFAMKALRFSRTPKASPTETINSAAFQMLDTSVLPDDANGMLEEALTTA